MKYPPRIRVIAALILFSVCPPIEARHELEKNDFLDMKIEALLRTPVSIATRSITAIKYSPSSVYQFSREEIKSLGVQNVYELLNYVPGYHLTRTIDFSDTSRIHIRGMDTGDNGYVLVLLNGVPLNEISLGRAQVYVPMIPAPLVENVEIITGPGAAIYGNYAYLGVISIETRTTDSEFGIAAGGKDSHEFYGLFSHYLDDDHSWRFSSGYYDYTDHGFDYLLSGQSTTDPKRHRNLFNSLEYGNWRLDFGWSGTRQDKFLQFAIIADDFNRFKVDNWYLQLGNSWKPHPDWLINTAFNYTQHNINQLFRLGGVTARDGITRPELIGPYGRSEAFNLNLEAQYDISGEQRLSFGVTGTHNGLPFSGVNINHQRNNGVFDYLGGVKQVKHTFLEQEGFYNGFGVYGQYEHIFNDGLRTTMGLRHDYYELTKEHTTNPRLAVIYSPTESVTTKLIYGTAYRAPSSEEKTSAVSDPNLKSENIETTELSFNKNFGEMDIQLTYFDNSLEDLIEQKTRQTGETLRFSNVGDRKLNGVEGSLIWDLTDNIRVKANYSRILKTAEETRFRNTASFIVNYRNGPLAATWFGNYRSAIRETNFEEGSVFLANMSIDYALSKESSLFAKCNNLFDKSYRNYVPALGPHFGASLPGRERLCMLGFRYTG